MHHIFSDILGWLNLNGVILSGLTDLPDTSWFDVFSFLGFWAIVWLPIAFLVSRLINWQPKEPLTPQQKLVLLASLYVLAPGIIAAKIKAESISISDLGLSLIPGSLWYVLLGLGVSLASLILIFSLESISSLVIWHWQNAQKMLTLLVPILGLSLLISFVEELIFRGYIFAALLKDNSPLVAAIASSFIFAILHLVWERKQTFPQLPGLWLMGMVLVMARVLSNDTIYFSLGLHAGWIWGLTCIDSADLLSYKADNHWFTGIQQQPLAGIAGILCMLGTGLAIWLGSVPLLPIN
ncbi:MAG: type II CAAX endopeptidase family protein [Cyanobacteria bacterium J06600_6]